MAEHWVENHKRDAWRRQAKASGYRARSAFKLKQIQERFQLVRSGDLVLDVGCHPGGWAQVAVELVGEEGRVVGVDLQPCARVEGAVLVVQGQVGEVLGSAVHFLDGEEHHRRVGGQRFDLVTRTPLD